MIAYQNDIFAELYPKFVIDKEIRLIELFAGIGSQAKALKNLGAEFTHYRVVEINKHAMAAYNAIHGTDFETSDITKIHADDLGIVERDKYCYLMTYSFPCQDLSLSGLQKGMAKGSGTRSGLLWEVERLLDECKGNLPQVLLMENVTQVISKKNISDFYEWRGKLESLGYSNYVDILNAKDFGIPQNRARCFMVSILGEYSYAFPKKKELNLRLKDMLDEVVDDKYYLSEKMLGHVLSGGTKNYYLKPEIDLDTARPLVATMHKMHRAGADNYVSDKYAKNGERCMIAEEDEPNRGGLMIPEKTKKGYAIAEDGDGVYINRPHQKRGTVQKGMIQTIKTTPDVGVVIDESKKAI